jgi:putative inorganic carbon (HCO3(-)) transporter
VYPQSKYQEFTGKKIIVDKAHNEYLQIGVTLGLPALFFYLLILFDIYKKGINSLKQLKRKINEIEIYHTALFMAVLSYTVTALFNISVVPVAPVFWAILGLNIAVSKVED